MAEQYTPLDVSAPKLLVRGTDYTVTLESGYSFEADGAPIVHQISEYEYHVFWGITGSIGANARVTIGHISIPGRTFIGDYICAWCISNSSFYVAEAAIQSNGDIRMTNTTASAKNNSSFYAKGMLYALPSNS